jgi:hypothetical protein
MYCCSFPNCDFTTEKRREIDYHHIVPRELGGNNKRNNRMWVCANHHRLIYVPDSKNGHHSIKSKNSIMVKGFLQSTMGTVLHYINCNDNQEYFYVYQNKESISV